jgi:hypothetical protein
MAVTMDTLREGIEVEGIRIFQHEDDALLVPIHRQGQMFHLEIERMEEGGYVRGYIPWFMKIEDTPFRERVLVRLLRLNGEYKILKFAYDDNDGEVCVSVEIPVEDGTLTREQLHRMMYILTQVVFDERERLVMLMTKGIYPESGDIGFQESLDRLFADYEGESLDDLDEIVAEEDQSGSLDLFEDGDELDDLMFEDED